METGRQVVIFRKSPRYARWSKEFKVATTATAASDDHFFSQLLKHLAPLDGSV